MYESYYQLHTNPFSLTPDPKFCFSHSGYQQAREYMEYALKLGEGLVMVTGRPGTGKTTLAETFLNTLNMETVRAARIAASSLDANDLLRAVAYAFDVEAEHHDKATLRHCIRECLEQLMQSGRRPLLIIDEAQGLSHTALDELRLLTDLQSGPYQLLQLFLIGQDTLRELMSVPEMEYFQQRVIANYHLVPLSLMESRDYIEYRLRQAGWQGDPELTGAAVRDIYRFSKGVPRYINKLCNRLLLLGYGIGSHTLDSDDVQAIAEEMEAELLGPIASAQAVSAGVDMMLDGEALEPDLLSDLAIKRTSQSAAVTAALAVSAAGDRIPRRDRFAAQPLSGSSIPVPAGATTHANPRSLAHQPAAPLLSPALRGGRLAAANGWSSRLAPSLLVLTVASLTTTAVTGIFKNEDVHQWARQGSAPESPVTLQESRVWNTVVGAQAFPDAAQSMAEPMPALPGVAQSLAEPDGTLLPRMPIEELPAPAAGIPPASVATAGTKPLDSPLTEAQAFASRNTEVDELLAQGRQALQDFRLLTPGLHSAYYYFQSALRLAPDNADAIAGITKITERYVELANRALEQQDKIMADRYIARGLSLQPDNLELLALKEGRLEPVIGSGEEQQERRVVKDDLQQEGDFFSRIKIFLSSVDQERQDVLATYEMTSSYLRE
jgi:type II secretory pathway predicted ATPase ExeA